MKSFFVFLSRNKGYTLINFFGLSVSLMFVMLIGLYTWQERSIDRQLDNAGRIEVLCFDFGDGNTCDGTHHVNVKHFRKQYPEIESACGVCFNQAWLSFGGDYTPANILAVDTSFFHVFDYRLIEGDRRTCLNDRNGIVITRSYARRLFGNGEAMGQTVSIADTIRFCVTGVMQDMDNSVFNRPDVLMNFAQEGRLFNASNTDEMFEQGSVNMTGCSVFLLMRPGHTFAGRGKELSQFITTFWPKFIFTDEKLSTFTTPFSHLYLSDVQPGNDVTRRGNPTLISILMLATLAILLFAVTNYINLTVALSGRRTREMATRQLFGATRRSVFAKLVAESMLLCLSAWLVALLLAVALAPVMGHQLNTTLQVSRLFSPACIGLSLLLILVVGALSGFIPGIITSRVKPIEIIKGTFVHQTKMVLGRVFIVFQNVITITMLGCALVMLAQLSHLVNAPMGFNKDNVLVVSSFDYTHPNTIRTFMDLLRRESCVANVTASMGTPLDGGNNNTMTFNGKKVSMQLFVADPNFMDVYGLTLKDGSKPQPRHFYINSQAEADIRNVMGIRPEELLRKNNFYGTDSLDTYGGRMNEFLIDNIQRERHPMFIDVRPQVDYPWAVSIKVKGNPQAAFNTVADVYHTAFHKTMTDNDAQFADRIIQDKFHKEQLTSHLVAIFAFMAILISMLGLVAMATYYIGQRAKEIAIRKVFGSTGAQVRRRLIGTFMRYVAVAFVIGSALTVWLMQHWMSQFSYRAVWWPWILVAGAVVFIVSLLAVFMQSKKAGNENPVNNIKQE